MNETPEPPPAAPRDDGGQWLEQRFKFRRVNEITGALVLAVIVVLITAVIWTGHSQRWFKSNVSLRITLPEDGAAGIRQGSEVYFLGTLVGSVSDVAVDATGRMEAQASIRRDFFRFVRVDSSAVVKKKFGVAGDSFFEITRAQGQPLPEDKAIIVCKEQFQSALETAIEEVRAEALLVLKKTSSGLDAWTKLGASLGETQQRLDALTVRLGNLAAGVEQGKGTVGKIFTDASPVEDLQKLLARANLTMGELQGVVTNANAAVKNVKVSTERLPEITTAIADEARDLPGLVKQAQTSMREMERLIEAAQRHWLLRKYVNQTNPPAMKLDSAGEAEPKQPPRTVRSPKDSNR